jgi:hypothetical protein
MNQKLKIALLLLTFPPIFTGDLLKLVFGDTLETTVHNDWIFAIINLYTIQDFLLVAIPLVIWTTIISIGLYSIFRPQPARDRSSVVIVFTLLSGFFLTIFIPMIFLWS